MNILIVHHPHLPVYYRCYWRVVDREPNEYFRIELAVLLWFRYTPVHAFLFRCGRKYSISKGGYTCCRKLLRRVRIFWLISASNIFHSHAHRRKTLSICSNAFLLRRTQRSFRGEALSAATHASRCRCWTESVVGVCRSCRSGQKKHKSNVDLTPRGKDYNNASAICTPAIRLTAENIPTPESSRNHFLIESDHFLLPCWFKKELVGLNWPTKPRFPRRNGFKMFRPATGDCHNDFPIWFGDWK